MHTITLVCKDHCWLAVSSDPMVRELFGTDVLPTAFSSKTPASVVLARIQELNPDCEVGVLEDASV